MPSHLRLSDEDPPQLSIIIPCLNEAGHLPALLADLNKQRRLHSEVLLADGSSTDNSAAIAREHGARVIESNPGRGRQMNIAVQQARGEWLLFLHADSRLSDIRQLSRALRCLKQA
ncbi:MAG: glycosyltransferase, partial [Salinisphaeraceae bacterium]|nr:glycosyltransferase [Salinisphaeraceae bacterium]